MLLYYFADKDELLGAVLSNIAGDMQALLEQMAPSHPQLPEDLKAHLRPMVLGQTGWPYLALWLELAGRAARNEAPYADIANAIGQGFIDWLQPLLDVPPADAAAEAKAVLADIEGWVLLKAIGLSD